MEQNYFYKLTFLLTLLCSSVISAQTDSTQKRQEEVARARVAREMNEVYNGKIVNSAPKDVVFVNLELSPKYDVTHKVADVYDDGKVLVKAIGWHDTNPKPTDVPGLTTLHRSVVTYTVHTHEPIDGRIDFDVYLKCADGIIVLHEARDGRLGGEKYVEDKFNKGSPLGWGTIGGKPGVKAVAIGITNVKIKPL